MTIIKKFVPNFTKGRAGYSPIVVVIHIGEGNFGSIQERTELDEERFGAIYSTFLHEERSSHYCVKENGEVVQFVDEQDTAWHAGLVRNPTSELVIARKGTNPNLFTIGIEHEGFGANGISDEQYRATAELVKDICTRWNIPIERTHILRHQEIRADKSCPGAIDVDRILSLIKTPQPSLEAQNSALWKIIYELQRLLGMKKVGGINGKYQTSMSQTQLANIATSAGLIAFILSQFGIVFPQDKIAFILMAAWSLGWTGYNYWQRYQKGDVTLGGIRK